ncbi:MAG: signal peptidase I [Eubacteriales bacterium]
MKQKRQKSEIREWIESAAIAIILALIIKFFFFEFVLVEGSSMLPTLHNSDRLMVTKIQYYFHEPEFGDIVILNYSESVEFVKRVIGKEGDTIEIKNSVVYLNNEALEEAYINQEPYSDFPLVVIPKDTFFVMGDNRINSRDSRSEDVGFIKKDEIVGKVVFRIYPFDRLGKVE